MATKTNIRDSGKTKSRIRLEIAETARDLAEGGLMSFADADKITARGVNGAEPVTKPGECVGTKKTPALIACLAPDRRVEVEVTGTKQ